jgi:hypothetical protein
MIITHQNLAMNMAVTIGNIYHIHILKKHETSAIHIKNSTKYCKLKISLSDKTTIDVIEHRKKILAICY